MNHPILLVILAIVILIIFKGGLMQKNSISYEEAEQLIQDEKALVVDVRRADEYAQGHIPNAKLIPLDQISTRAEKELKDKDRPIILYCRSGNRSNQALKILEHQGYTHLYNLGGLHKWKGKIQ
ncbi:MAG: rhodanese-like domain-containing protein [Tissierellia bacterium]|nr:rhodanese-like domain-containing protein [Tissierellia bacterium]